MAEAFMQRTVTCGQLRRADEGKTVVLNGWVHRDRNHGALHFINLRDRYGMTQVVVDDDATEELQKAASELKLEYCIAVQGIVRRRPDSMINEDMITGEIEVKAEKIQILSTCATLPFMIEDETNAKEDLRLKYRFLDLRDCYNTAVPAPHKGILALNHSESNKQYRTTRSCYNIERQGADLAPCLYLISL